MAVALEALRILAARRLLRVGDLVYSVDHGRVLAVPLVAVHRSAVRNHHVVHVDLESGVSLEISGPHPTADGRRFADLRTGDHVGAVAIVGVRQVPYAFEYTYDVLPASDSGTYFAAGVLIGSTLGGEASRLGPVDFSAISMPR